MFYLSLRPGLKYARAEFEGEEVEAFTEMGSTTLGLMGANTSTATATPFLRRELDEIDGVVNPAKIMMLPPKGHAPTVESISLLASANVRIAERGRGTGGGCFKSVPISG